MFYSKVIPVLAYHHVLPENEIYGKDKSNFPFIISTKQFIHHVSFLLENGYQSLHLKDILNSNHFNKTNSEKFIILTFDDGYLNNYKYAFPILKQFGFTASFFVVSGLVNKEYYMSWSELREMLKYGMTIGSHTVSHLPLGNCSITETKLELENSKIEIEEKIGDEVNFVSFPHGSYNHATLDIAKKLEYSGCFTSNWGFFSNRSKRMEIERIMIRKNIRLKHFKKIVERKKFYALKMNTISKVKRRLENFIGLENYNKLLYQIYGHNTT